MLFIKKLKKIITLFAGKCIFVRLAEPLCRCVPADGSGLSARKG